MNPSTTMTPIVFMESKWLLSSVLQETMGIVELALLPVSLFLRVMFMRSLALKPCPAMHHISISIWKNLISHKTHWESLVVLRRLLVLCQLHHHHLFRRRRHCQIPPRPVAPTTLLIFGRDDRNERKGDFSKRKRRLRRKKREMSSHLVRFCQIRHPVKHAIFRHPAAQRIPQPLRLVNKPSPTIVANNNPHTMVRKQIR